MVESIYGRKTHPQFKHERIHFGLHRRASGEPANLRTIAETDDDAAACSNVDSTFLRAEPLEYRKPRAISLPLPTVYRDGSYLRINVSEAFNYERARRRRFSEPAVAWSTTLQRDPFDDDCYHDFCAFPVTPKISINEDNDPCLKTFDVEKRRHSDPLLYTTTNKQDAVFLPSLTSPIKNHHDQVNRSHYDNPLTQISDPKMLQDNYGSAATENTESKQLSYSVATPTRRRKSSLVPIPFGVNKSASRSRQKTDSRRRFSFPLTKNENELTRNLQEIDRSFEITPAHVFDDFLEKELLGPCDFMDVKFNDFSTPQKEEFSEENKTNCENIITQWMKFFG